MSIINELIVDVHLCLSKSNNKFEILGTLQDYQSDTSTLWKVSQ